MSKGCEYEADINPGTMPKNGSLPALAHGGNRYPDTDPPGCTERGGGRYWPDAACMALMKLGNRVNPNAMPFAF